MYQDGHLLDEIVFYCSKSFIFQNALEEQVHLQFLKLMLTIVTSNQQISSGLIVGIEACFQIFANGQKMIETTSKAALTQMVNFVFSKMERKFKEDQILLQESIDLLKFLSQNVLFEKDKEINNLILKHRLLGLELVTSILNNAGTTLVTHETFHPIVQELCLGISHNSIATNPQLFELSFSVFLLLIRHFRHLLKLEIEVLLNTVFLQILEMGNSTYQQRLIVLQGLYKICEHPQTLMDIYFNYDVDFQMTSVYEKLMGITSRICQGRTEAKNSIFESKSDQKEQDKKLRNKALQVLEAITRSLVLFSKSDVKEEEKGDSPVVLGGKNVLDSITMTQTLSLSKTEDTISSDQLEKVANQKQVFTQGIKLFNSKPNRGMKFLIDNKFVQDDPESIAQFLRQTPQLSKHAIGDYIGDGDQYNIKVMRTFVDQMDFAGLDFVAALRLFLQAFRLPGEAQKIDRLVEKFADRYCEGNPTIFAKADTAYTLAFSVIMLNTDQHSSQIKHRMDVQAFIKNNRGINDEGDLPEAFLVAIFNEIQQNEIIMEDEGKIAEIAMGWGAVQSETKRMEQYKKEAVTIQKKSQMLISGKNRQVSAWKTANSKELIRPMFSLSTWAFMAAFSIQFEGSLDEETTVLCLSGFSNSIYLSCTYELETEKDAFVTSLAKLTNLSDVYSITDKNIKAIYTLVDIGAKMGEHMQKGWIHIIRSISQLDYLQQVVSDKVSPALAQFVQELQGQSGLKQIDQIFMSSVKLSGGSIVAFFRAVCEISLEEVGSQNAQKIPRSYLLQKIVEIAYYNMNRIRFEWSQIWRVLQPHFNTVALHQTQQIATFAVDALRQLGTKILEREELGHFSSQNEFLKSFEYIIKHTNSPTTRELIINSISQMITSRAGSIRSGWRSIFSVLLKAAQTDDKMQHQAFAIVQNIFKNNLEHLVSSNVFVDLVSCLAEFALLHGQGPQHDEQIMTAIQMLQSCTKSLVQRAEEESLVQLKRKPKSVASISTSQVMKASPQAPRINNLPQQAYLTEQGTISEEHFYLSWFPILSAFSRVINESDSVLVRTHTMETLFETFKSSGHLFEPIYWKAIQRNVISPIFDDLYETDPQSQEARAAVLILGLRLLVDLVSVHFDLLVSFTDFLEKSLDRMVLLMGNPDEKLASTGQICLNQFLSNNALKIAHLKERGFVMDRITNGFTQTFPQELVNIRIEPLEATGHLKFVLDWATERATKDTSLETIHFEQTVIKCVTHLEYVQSVRDFCLASETEPVICLLNASERDAILDSIYTSYSMARSFNHNMPLRHAIFRRGWVSQLPNLVRQESLSLQIYMTLLFSLIKHHPEGRYVELLTRESFDVLERCVQYSSDPKFQRELVSWSPTLMALFKQLSVIEWTTDHPLYQYLEQYFRYSIKLVFLEQPRLVIQEFMNRICDLLFKNEIRQ
ncbi:hypothetical protein EDD86DRAFT_213601 [Gorgonomyces haynaldii]|nr:hypothetical protein EDD86DRAFT_213601 [Gorgonomyces haynaldii]